MLIAFGWMGSARVIRAMAQSLINRDFVKAARYVGVHPFKIVMMRHLVPNIGSLLVLNFTSGIMGAVLLEVAYSFIGIGIKYPNYSLGSLISDASQQINTLPHMFWFPVLFFFLLVGPLALMNDGLRDAFDRLRCRSVRSRSPRRTRRQRHPLPLQRRRRTNEYLSRSER